MSNIHTLLKKDLVKYGVFLLSLSFFFPEVSFARKKKFNNEKEIAMLMTAEPDVLAMKATNETQMGHAIAISNTHLNSHKSAEFREGIDVSHYQGHINWDEVAKGTSISYVYLKATEGATYVDDTYDRNLREVRRVGLNVGSYHFYRPNTCWKEQLKNMTSIVKVENQDLVPIIDIEHRGSVSPTKFIEDLKLFINKVTEHYGKKPLLYTYQKFYNRYLLYQFKDYHFMIAQYRSDSPLLNDGKDYIMWQYTSSGSIPGIKGDVDRSKIMDNFSLNQVMM